MVSDKIERRQICKYLMKTNIYILIQSKQNKFFFYQFRFDNDKFLDVEDLYSMVFRLFNVVHSCKIGRII